MRSESHSSRPRGGRLRRLTGFALNGLAGIAALLGFQPKAAAPSPSPPMSAETGNVPTDGADSDHAGLRDAHVQAILRGTWTPPAPLGTQYAKRLAEGAETSQASAKFDDLGFLDHIDSGFHDFNDR